MTTIKWQVEIHGWNRWTAEPELKGTIVWDGEKLIPSNEDMRHVIDDPIRIMGEQDVIDAKIEPERFLRSLHLMYRGSYFTALPATKVRTNHETSEST